MTPTLYGIANCDTVKRARAWLDDHRVAYQFHDYKKAGIDRAQLEARVAEFGWETILNRAGTTFRKLPEDQRALVTCEGAFSYLARDAGLTEQYLWAVNAEQQATPQQVAGTIRFVEDSDVPAVFCESTVSDEAMQKVVSATGTAFGGTLYVDSLSGPDGPVPTYLDLLRHDVDTVVAGLTGTGGTGGTGGTA